jgi:hypothetical protein
VSQGKARAGLRAVIVVGALTLGAAITARPDPSGPVVHWSGEELTLMAAWAVAVSSCAWLVFVSAVCELGLRTRRDRVARIGARLAPAFVRRLSELALVGSVVVASAVPAGASDHRAPPRPQDEPVVRAPVSSPEEHRAARPATPPVAPPPAASAVEHTYAVRPGDNLWRIARAELVVRGHAQPDDATIARYWHTVIAANRHTLRSGDPNLIFPGELVTLPEPG